ncbi:MAG: rod shape-determining protein MreC [Tannerella sp.]|nr:rod shape-determining protein MreC [Tannerella sp.]
MQKLLEFLVGKRHWLAFILCEIISFTCLFSYNAYQRNVILSSSSVVTGYISSVSASVMSYLGLRSENKMLFDRISRLEQEILRLQRAQETLRSESLVYENTVPDSILDAYQYIAAEIVNNGIVHIANYLTINKGWKDGIQPDMGVVSVSGVVGIVSTVNEHFSVIIPLLNPKSRLSCKLYKDNYYGSLIWTKTSDLRYADLEEIPRHAEFAVGDTIVTSGYSAIFPAGIIVGTIENFNDNNDNNFYSLKIKLATDFQRLKYVRVIKNNFRNEQLEVEREARKND